VCKLLSLRLAAVPASVGTARASLTELCSRFALGEELADRVRLAVTEACTNVVRHAYGQDAAHATYTVEATLERATLLITVRDTGVGMPRAGAGATKNAGLNLGLQIMARTAASVDVFSRTGNGTRIALRFNMA
jgi:serine/threonine-protein kinase RsbW